MLQKNRKTCAGTAKTDSDYVTYKVIERRISKHCKLTVQGVPRKHLILKDMKAEIKATETLKCVEITE